MPGGTNAGLETRAGTSDPARVSDSRQHTGIGNPRRAVKPGTSERKPSNRLSHAVAHGPGVHPVIPNGRSFGLPLLRREERALLALPPREHRLPTLNRHLRRGGDFHGAPVEAVDDGPTLVLLNLLRRGRPRLDLREERRFLRRPLDLPLHSLRQR